MRVVQTLMAAQVITRNDGANERSADRRAAARAAATASDRPNGPTPPALPKR